MNDLVAKVLHDQDGAELPFKCLDDYRGRALSSALNKRSGLPMASPQFIIPLQPKTSLNILSSEIFTY